MASFAKRGKTWQYTISRMVNGKSKPIRKGGFKTKKEAQIAAAEIESKMNKGFSPVTQKIPFNQYFEDWYKLYKTKIAKSTLRNYNYTLQIIDEYFGDKPLQDIRKREYQEFLNEYGKTKSKVTVSKVHGHIKACVQEAVAEGIIHIDFTRKSELHWGKDSRKGSEKHLNYADSQTLLNGLMDRLDQGAIYYLLLLGLTSGMRFSEMIGLTRKDFDFTNNMINIDKTWGYVTDTKKGFGETKNKNSIRKIKMDNNTMKAFENFFKYTPENLERLVFYSPLSKNKVLSNSGANKILRETLDELGISRITVHGLRHTHASVLLYKNVSVYYVSERLGHKDLDTTLKTYSHILSEMREREEKETTNIFDQMIV